ncbi:unnamed protein product [Ixodes hexagonus]
MLYNCPTCGRQFRQNTGLWRHLRTHNPSMPRPRYPCTVCNQEFSRLDYLRAHSATHDDPQKRRFVCELCGHGFLQSSDLNRHRLIHSAERQFQCTVCERTFSDRSSRNRHEREHNAARRYVCVTCGTTFKRTSKLRCHVTRMHGDSAVSELCTASTLRVKSVMNTRTVVPTGSERLSVRLDGTHTSTVCNSSNEDAVFTSDRTGLLEEADSRLQVVNEPSMPGERQHDLRASNTSLCYQTADTVSNSGALLASGEPASDIPVTDNLRVLNGPTGDLPRSDRLTAVDRLTNGVQTSDGLLLNVPLEPDVRPLLEGSMSDNLQMSAEPANGNGVLVSHGPPRPEDTSDKLPGDRIPSANEVPVQPGLANGLLVADDTITPTESFFGRSPGNDGLPTADKVPSGLEVIPGALADDILRRSFDSAIVQEEGFCGETDFASFPDFGSQAYYDWLASFTSVCNLLSLPLDAQVFVRVTQVLKTVSDALAVPSGILACQENFAILLGIWDDLQRLIGKHLSFVMEHLQA